jgi:hypothetical protein
MADESMKPKKNMKDAISEILAKYDGYTVYVDESIEYDTGTIGVKHLTQELAEAVVAFIMDLTKEDVKKSLLGR